jgi:hypothetical protein
MVVPPYWLGLTVDCSQIACQTQLKIITQLGYFDKFPQKNGAKAILRFGESFPSSPSLGPVHTFHGRLPAFCRSENQLQDCHEKNLHLTIGRLY